MAAYDHRGDDGYLLLANAVIKSAVTDYRAVLAALLQNPEGTRRVHLLRAKQRLEDFFYSDWFEMLTDLDPVTLLRKVTEITVRTEKEKAEDRIRKLQRKREKQMMGIE